MQTMLLDHLHNNILSREKYGLLDEINIRKSHLQCNEWNLKYLEQWIN